MSKIVYTPKNFRAGARNLINLCNGIIAEYQAQGYSLTLRQLYYQMVARGHIENSQKSYKTLGSIVNDARLAGMIDWEVIEDRTRNLHTLSTWNHPKDIIRACANQFRIDKWGDQRYYVECWIEKEALSGVFERICDELEIPFFACRGYTSQSEMWGAAMRLEGRIHDNKEILIIHFGDHDPSGIDMSRDIEDRLSLFLRGQPFEFRRLALNMDQVNEYQPPPNPAKTTDSRYESYIRDFGDESWELDALEPSILSELVRNEVMSVRNESVWEASLDVENEHKRLLGEVAENWDKLIRRV